MKLLIVSATPFEIAPLEAYLQANFEQKEQFYTKNDLQVYCLVTGVGQLQTAFHTGFALARLPKFDLAINAGIAGAFDKKLLLGEVVNVISERLGDLGVEENDGRFVDMHELQLIDGNSFPFSDNGLLQNPGAAQSHFLKNVTGLTVNRVHGFAPNIMAIEAKYACQIETMEGAAFFYACLLNGLPFLQLRAISNYVEPRNRANWNIALAIKNLNETLVSLIETYL